MQRDEDARRRLAEWLSRRFFVRFHLSLILAFAFCIGLLATKAFLALGLETMHWRWPLALFAAYAAFLLGIRVWLAHVGIGRYLDDAAGKAAEGVLDVVDDVASGNGSGGGGWSTGGGRGGGGGGFSGGGGRMGGGGANGNFDPGPGSVRVAMLDGGSTSAASPSSGGWLSGRFSGGGGGGSGGGSDEGLLVVLLIVALLAVIFGAGIYLIWQAPSLLAEAAFEGALAGGLVRSIHRVNDPGWVGGAIRASAGPFFVIFVCAMTIAGLAEHYAPEAPTLAAAIHQLLQ